MWTSTQKRSIWEKYLEVTGDMLTGDDLIAGFLQLLINVADAGGSEMYCPDVLLIVSRRDLQTQQFVPAYGEKMSEYITEFRKSKFYTNHRLLASFADYTVEALSSINRMTLWGKKAGIKKQFAKYSFPGAEFATNIPDAAITNLSAARDMALSTAADQATVSTNYRAVRARYQGIAPTTQQTLTL